VDEWVLCPPVGLCNSVDVDYHCLASRGTLVGNEFAEFDDQGGHTVGGWLGRAGLRARERGVRGWARQLHFVQVVVEGN
jgi:hypothetical protein